MDNFKKWVKKNIESFSDQEPDPGHFERFSEKLGRESDQHSFIPGRFFFLKVAAVIILLLTVAVFVFDFASTRLKSAIESSSAGTSVPGEMDDVMHYYSMQTANRMSEFKVLACCGEQEIKLNALVSEELNTLDVNAMELKQTLLKNPGNERIEAALIQNQQMKEKVLDNMIALLKQNKK